VKETTTQTALSCCYLPTKAEGTSLLLTLHHLLLSTIRTTRQQASKQRPMPYLEEQHIHHQAAS
jgi:hypothetical protein